MPLYEYTCKECGEVTTELKKVDERDTMPECKVCKCSVNMHRGIHTTGLWMKGKGWYHGGFHNNAKKK